jgi:hypothetical protein
MDIDGGCHCGRISFRATVDPLMVAICHCTDCQTLSGSPYRAMVSAAADQFEIDGEPRVYVKTAASGRKRAQAFCPDCGSPIYAADPVSPKTFAIRLGGIRQRRLLGPPVRQIWCASALEWASDISGVPCQDP